MSRDDGFLRADIDVNITRDPKFVRLARELGDLTLFYAHVGVYVEIVNASWRTGNRVSIEEAALPGLPIDGYAAGFQRVGLLDAAGRIPAKSWTKWFDPASDRRESKVRGGIVSGLMAHGMTREEAEVEADKRLMSRRNASRLRGRVPARGRAREDGHEPSVDRTGVSPGSARSLPEDSPTQHSHTSRALPTEGATPPLTPPYPAVSRRAEDGAHSAPVGSSPDLKDKPWNRRTAASFDEETA